MTEHSPSGEGSVRGGNANAVAPKPLLARLIRRIAYLVVVFGAVGAIVGRALNGLEGLILGVVIGIIVGAVGAILLSCYAWIFDGPARGAIRGGALFAVGMASIVPILLFWPGQEKMRAGEAWKMALMLGGMGGGVGVPLGAFLGWLAGPIFRGMVQDIDDKANQTRSS